MWRRGGASSTARCRSPRGAWRSAWRWGLAHATRRVLHRSLTLPRLVRRCTSLRATLRPGSVRCLQTRPAHTLPCYVGQRIVHKIGQVTNDGRCPSISGAPARAALGVCKFDGRFSELAVSQQRPAPGLARAPPLRCSSCALRSLAVRVSVSCRPNSCVQAACVSECRVPVRLTHRLHRYCSSRRLVDGLTVFPGHAAYGGNAQQKQDDRFAVR